MSRSGDVLENPVTGERVLAVAGTEDSGDGRITAELRLKPGGAATGEHVHPEVQEWFTVWEGRVALRLDGEESIAPVGERIHVPPGMAHDFRNVGETEARVVVEVWPGERFEAMIVNLFGLARDGKTNARGMPNILQAAVFVRKFRDVMYFTKPPPILQKVLFGVLAPVAKLLGYRGSYPKYLERAEAEARTKTPAKTPGNGAV